MKITKLSLTNFRSFKDTQTMDFAPVTLLVGPNSVGKSSVLMALFYLQQIIEKGQCNPQKLEALNDKYIGGFKKLVHGHDIRSKIKIKIEFDKNERIGNSYGVIEDLFEDFNIGISSPSEAAKKMSIDFEIAWSESLDTAYISRYTVAFDGENIAEVTSDSGLKQPMLSAINFLHPLLLPDNHDEWLINSVDEGISIHEALKENYLHSIGGELINYRDISKGYNDDTYKNEFVITFNENAYVSEFHELVTEPRTTNENNKFSTDNSLVNELSFVPYKISHIPIAVDCHSGALPKLGKKLKTSLALEDAKINERATEIFSDLVVAPLDNLFRILKDSLCIGPLRTVPNALCQINSAYEQKDWYDGSAAWDVLATADLVLMNSVNDWVSNPAKLNLGYGIALRVDKTFSEIKRSTEQQTHHSLIENLDSEISSLYKDDISKGFSKVDEIITKSGYSIWDINNTIAVSPNEIGVGISQLMPLIVASLSRKQGLIACEQPELHVHPRVQVDIGDLLTQTNSSVSFLIETHSEHLVLRLLKRIRQTTENELPTGYLPVLSNNISIIYLEAKEEGVKATRIDIDEDGEFKQHWPHGFFSERREELM